MIVKSDLCAVLTNDEARSLILCCTDFVRGEVQNRRGHDQGDAVVALGVLDRLRDELRRADAVKAALAGLSS